MEPGRHDLSAGIHPQGARHQHHRLRRLRGAGGRGRGAGPRLGDVLDQEEHPSRQDRLDLAGGGGDGSGHRRRQAPRLAGAEADDAQSLGGLRRIPPCGSRGGGRRQEHHRVWPLHRPSGRHRRHGPPVRPQLGGARRRCDPQLPQGRRGQGGRARGGRREGAGLALAQGRRRGPRLQRLRRREARRHRHSSGDVHRGRRNRGGARRVQILHTPLRPVPGPLRAAPRAVLHRRQRRRSRDECERQVPQDRPEHQGTRSRRGEGGRRAVRLFGFRRLSGRHSRRRAQERFGRVGGA